MDMELKRDLSARFYQSSRAFAKHVRLLTNRILRKPYALLSVSALVGSTAVVAVISRSNHSGSDVVDNVVTFDGNNLNRLNITVLGEAGINHNIRPPIGSVRLYDYVFRQ